MPHTNLSPIAALARAPIGSLAAAVAIAGCATGASITPMESAAETGATAGSGGAPTHAITVSIDSIENAGGELRVALYSTPEGFAAQAPVASLREPVTGPTASVSFDGVPEGDYAVMLFHDVDGSGELERNLLGVPREPWAGSLNRSILGAPDWEDVVFELDGADLALGLSL